MPEGIGYVSYNTYPGWHMRGAIRDMMCHHIGRFAGEPPARQVARRGGLLEFLARLGTGGRQSLRPDAPPAC